MNTLLLNHRVRCRTKRSRRGATILEFSLAFPILLLLLFAGIEFSRANVLINTAKVAAAEGARRGIVLGTTADDVRATVERELSTVGVAASRILVDPAVITDDTEVVTVGLYIPLDARNGYVTPRYFVGEYIWKISTIPREAKNDARMDALLSAAFEKMEGELGSAIKADKTKSNNASNANQNAKDNASDNSAVAAS